MHEAKPYGHLLVNGIAPTDTQLAVLAGAPLDQIPNLLGELEATGVFSRTQKGVIFSRRMTRDEKKARVAAENGKNGGNPTLRKQSVISVSDNLTDNPPDKPQKPEARHSVATATASDEWTDDSRRQLFTGGIAWLRKQTGQTDARCRGLVGRWLKSARDDSIAVLALVRQARDRDLADPIAWIEAALQSKPTSSGELPPDWPRRAEYFHKHNGRWRDEWGDREDIPPEHRSLFNQASAA